MQRAPYAGKIFAIGFYKTGTTTVFEALKGLGYRTINGDKPGSYPGADDGEALLKQIEAGDCRLPTLDLFDAFTDNPYFHLWREMYAQFPDAKFILTVRDERPWIESRDSAYRSRPDQFLAFDPTQMREWSPLCEFLSRLQVAGRGGRPIGEMPTTI